MKYLTLLIVAMLVTAPVLAYEDPMHMSACERCEVYQSPEACIQCLVQDWYRNSACDFPGHPDCY